MTPPTDRTRNGLPAQLLFQYRHIVGVLPVLIDDTESIESKEHFEGTTIEAPTVKLPEQMNPFIHPAPGKTICQMYSARQKAVEIGHANHEIAPWAKDQVDLRKVLPWVDHVLEHVEHRDDVEELGIVGALLEAPHEDRPLRATGPDISDRAFRLDAPGFVAIFGGGLHEPPQRAADVE